MTDRARVHSAPTRKEEDGMIARWLRSWWRVAGPTWRQDARFGFAVGLAVAGPVLAWLGLR